MQVVALSKEEQDAIHEAALCVLEEVGVRVALPSLVSKMKGHDFPAPAEDRVLIPRARVEDALKSAPNTVLLGARAEDKQVRLDGTRSFGTTGGCGSKTLDMDSGEVRLASLEDVAASARLADALDQYDVYWTMINAQDVDSATSVARGFLTALQNTVMPIQVIDASRREEAETLVQMARALQSAGVMHGPPVSMLNSVVTPLRMDPDGTEAAMVFAEEGLPVLCCSMPIGGVTAPATPAGTAMIAHAEVLAFVTLLQSFYPGCPVVYCPFPVFGDPHTGSSNYWDSRTEWMGCATLQLGRAMGLPCFVFGELLALASGPDLCGGGGMLETSTVLSFEQMVIDDEAMRNARIATTAQEVSAETLAVDVVREVGPGGHFLAQRHTVEHMKEFPVFRFAESDRQSSDRAGDDEESAFQRARREARRLIETHRVEPLPEELASTLLEIAERAAHVGS